MSTHWADRLMQPITTGVTASMQYHYTCAICGGQADSPVYQLTIGQRFPSVQDLLPKGWSVMDQAPCCPAHDLMG